MVMLVSAAWQVVAPAFGGGAGGGVDAAAQAHQLAGVGAVEAVDGEVAQERAGFGERSVGQAFGEGLADLVAVGIAHGAAAEPVGPAVDPERDSVRGRRRRYLFVRLVVAGFGVGVHACPVPWGAEFQMVIISARVTGRR